MPLVADVLPNTIGPYITMMVVGFFVGIFGHIFRSRLAVAVGIMLIFIATLLLPLAVIATEEEPETPGQEIYAPGTR